MNLFIASDHRGFELKEKIKEFLSVEGHSVVDLGNHKYDKDDDYPDFAKEVAEKVSADPEETRGILLCGSGVGVDIVANKFQGVRSALAFSPDQIAMAKSDDDVNIISLPSEFLDEERTKEIINAWLNTKFSGEEKDKRRIGKIE